MATGRPSNLHSEFSASPAAASLAPQVPCPVRPGAPAAGESGPTGWMSQMHSTRTWVLRLQAFVV